jgi:type IV pilus assembly protein PilW
MTRSMHRRTTALGCRARGFSLVELMVAVTISLLLMMGVVALFVSSRASYETTEKLSRIQENGRYALDQIANDIRAAGYQGCSRPMGTQKRRAVYAINTVTAPANLLWDFRVPAQGFQGLGGNNFVPALVTNLDPAPRGEADVLVLRIPVRDRVPMRLQTKQPTGVDPLVVGGVNPAPDPGPAVITDCEARAWFYISGYNGNALLHAASGRTDAPDNSSTNLQHPFNAGAEIQPLVNVIYYLAQRPAVDGEPVDPNRPRLSLYRREGTNPSEEIAEGIERFEVRYGVDTTNDGRVDAYQDASATTNWNNVYSVQFAVLARAPEAYGTDVDRQQYLLLNAGIGGAVAIQAGPYNDRFQRKAFTATIALRNQIID